MQAPRAIRLERECLESMLVPGLEQAFANPHSARSEQPGTARARTNEPTSIRAFGLTALYTYTYQRIPVSAFPSVYANLSTPATKKKGAIASGPHNLAV